ncbi:MAG: sialidase family protein [Thermodesulfovibrionales bacterium]
MTRFFIILFIISLYLIGFYQNHETPDPWDLKNRTVLSDPSNKQLNNDKPYYVENFVNREGAGTISHVSSIAQANNDSLVCVWYSGSREGGRDVSILMSRSNKEGEWTEPVKLTDRVQTSIDLDRYIKKVGNPLIFSDKKGRLWLFYSSVTLGGWSGTTINYKVSINNGKTWSKARKMILSPLLNLTNNIKNKGILLDDGSFLVPTYHEFINKYSQLLWIRPVKEGAQYRIGKITREAKAIQPSLLYSGNNDLIAFFRNMSEEERKYILTSTSSDLGKTWSNLSDTRLPNPDSGFDMIALDNRTILGVINNSFRDRSDLSLVISSDKGKSWMVIKTLEDNPKKEYSYPSIMRSRDGLFHITYTFERKRIKHVAFNESWIRKLMEVNH